MFIRQPIFLKHSLFYFRLWNSAGYSFGYLDLLPFQKRQSIKYTVISVSFEAGFISKITFNTVFKKITGLTPTEFRQKNRWSHLYRRSKSINYQYF
ncbi:MAG: AraC family transcriptional regulator [Bacteroidetes bacterium]|nr:MAG: AraC family transcriptional regulator [Bacteroidota bacterium]